jgi:hypothetical protein
MSSEKDAQLHLQRIEEILLALLKIQLAPVLEKELNDEKKQKLYQATGKQSVLELSKKAKLFQWLDFRNLETLGAIRLDS